MVTVVGFILCIEAALPLLSFIPGGFAGTAVFFGTGFDLSGALIAVVAGALLGIVSERLGAMIQSAVDGRRSRRRELGPPNGHPRLPPAGVTLSR